MSATFTNDDTEKTVENATGEAIGTVTAVEGDTARVEPRAGIVDSIRARLGWRRGGGDTVVIHESAIDEISSGTIRLEAETEPTTERTGADGSGSAVHDTTEPTETDADSTEPDRDTHVDEPGHPGSIDEADEPALGTESEPDTAAERDRGDELGEVAKRDTADETDETTRENAAERPDEPGAADGVERIDTSEMGAAAGEIERDGEAETPGETKTTGEADSTDESNTDDSATDESNTDEPMHASGEHPTAAGVDEPEGRDTTETSGETEPQETDEGRDGAETQSSPDAMSGTESAESSGAMDRGGVQDVPMGDTAEPSADRSPETTETGGTEPTDEPAAETEPEETNLVDELDTGADLESVVDTESDEPDADAEANATAETDDIDLGTDLESATETAETGDRESDGETSETEPMDLADELDRGVDLESTAETDPRAEPTTDTRPEPELDPSVDVDSSAASDPRPENEVDPDADGTPVTAGSHDPALEFDPGVDIEAAVEPDRRSEPEIDPETVAGPETDAEAEVDAAAREIVPEGAAATERETAEASDERPPAESAADSTDRAREQGRSSSPLTAVHTAQQTAMTQGQELFKQSLAVQQRAARGAVEFPLIVQRQGLEAMQAAIRSYLDAVTAVMGTGTSASREQRQLLDEAVTELEETHTRLEDEELADGLATHLEQLRALQSRFDGRAEAGSEQAALLLERQVELLEECQRRLDAAGE